MPAVAEKEDVNLMPVNSTLLAAVNAAVQSALTMCGITARCVGAASVPVRDTGKVTGMIGLHGKASGFVTVNMTERVAIRAANSLLQENFAELNSQIVDATGEITNMVVGGIKSALTTATLRRSSIALPIRNRASLRALLRLRMSI